MSNFVIELEKALLKYSKHRIDVIIDEEKNVMYGSYHSLKDSFPVTKNYQLDKKKAIKIADAYHVGWSEI